MEAEQPCVQNEYDVYGCTHLPIAYVRLIAPIGGCTSDDGDLSFWLVLPSGWVIALAWKACFKGCCQRASEFRTWRAITQVAENVDLAEPIRNLANVLRQGGNLGAHFDMEKEPDKRMALQMLSLLENLIEFLHVLPHEIRSLEHFLDRGA